jgi:hypothetical protein
MMFEMLDKVEESFIMWLIFLADQRRTRVAKAAAKGFVVFTLFLFQPLLTSKIVWFNLFKGITLGNGL